MAGRRFSVPRQVGRRSRCQAHATGPWARTTHSPALDAQTDSIPSWPLWDRSTGVLFARLTRSSGEAQMNPHVPPRDLVGEEPPLFDDVPTTLHGERLDTDDKIRDFLARVADARST